jgi:hypothetical protein
MKDVEILEATQIWIRRSLLGSTALHHQRNTDIKKIHKILKILSKKVNTDKGTGPSWLA